MEGEGHDVATLLHSLYLYKDDGCRSLSFCTVHLNIHLSFMASLYTTNIQIYI